MGFIPKPSEAIESSTLLQNADVKVVDAVYAVFDFFGHSSQKEGNPTGAECALKVVVRPLTASDDSQDTTDYYPAAWITKFAPSEDGKTPLVNVGEEGKYIVLAEGSSASGLLKSSAMMRYLSELVNGGLPESAITDKADFLVGLEGHYERKPVTKKDGTVSKNSKGYDNTVGLITRVLKQPGAATAKGGAKATGAAKPAAASKPTATAATTAGPDAATFAKRALVEVMAEGNAIKTDDLKKQAFGLSLKWSDKPDAATRKAMCDMLLDPNFLLSVSAEADADGVFTFEDGVLTPLAA